MTGIELPEVVKSFIKNDIAMKGFDYPGDGPVLTLGRLAVGAEISHIIAIWSSKVGPSRIYKSAVTRQGLTNYRHIIPIARI